VDLHRLEVSLVVVSPLIGGQAKVLMTKSPLGILRLPTKALGVGEDTLSVAAALLKEYAGLQARINGKGWVDLVHCPLADAVNRTMTNPDEVYHHNYHKEAAPLMRVICVPYACMLPETVATCSAETEWVPIMKLFGNNLVWLDHADIVAGSCKVLV
jgi:hypothetical protein